MGSKPLTLGHMMSESFDIKVLHACVPKISPVALLVSLELDMCINNDLYDSAPFDALSYQI